MDKFLVAVVVLVFLLIGYGVERKISKKTLMKKYSRFFENKKDRR